MRLSDKTRESLYAAIHEQIVTVRIKLKLNPEDDIKLAQVEHKIWDEQKRVLKLPGYL